MVCFYTASEEARRAIRGESSTDSKISGDGNSEPTSPREKEGWETLLSRFWQAEQSFCDERFKLIPSVVFLYSYFFILNSYFSIIISCILLQIKFSFNDIYFRLKDLGW